MFCLHGDEVGRPWLAFTRYTREGAFWAERPGCAGQGGGQQWELLPPNGPPQGTLGREKEGRLEGWGPCGGPWRPDRGWESAGGAEEVRLNAGTMQSDL